MSSEEKKDINDLLLELENIHAELKAFSERLATALSTLQDFLDRVEKDVGIAKKIEASSKPLPSPAEKMKDKVSDTLPPYVKPALEIKTSEGIKEAIEVKPQPVLAKPATKRQKLYIMDLLKKANETMDLNKLSNMSAEDASVLIQQLKTKLEEKKVKGQ